MPRSGNLASPMPFLGLNGNNINVEVTPKGLELLHEVIPTATTFALLINPKSNPALAERTMRDLRASARTLGVQLHVVSATTDNEVEKHLRELGQPASGWTHN